MGTFTAPLGAIRTTLLALVWSLILIFAANALRLTVSAQPAPKLSSSGAAVAARTPYTVVLQETTRVSAEETVRGTITLALNRNGAFVRRMSISAVRPSFSARSNCRRE